MALRLPALAPLKKWIFLTVVLHGPPHRYVPIDALVEATAILKFADGMMEFAKRNDGPTFLNLPARVEDCVLPRNASGAIDICAGPGSIVRIGTKLLAEFGRARMHRIVFRSFFSGLRPDKACTISVSDS